MDIDPITRKEADKIELVLADLIDDLELIALLPAEFSLWLRDDIVPQLDKLTQNNGLDPQPGETLDEIEERHRYLQASAFIQAASHYGDAQDSIGNEALVQLSEFAQLEKTLLESSTTVGHVEASDLTFHRLSLRALLDTLREGGYGTCMREYLQEYYPAVDPDAEDGSEQTSSQITTVTAALNRQQGEDGDPDHSNDPPKVTLDPNYLPYNPATAAQDGIVQEGVNQLRETMYTLLRLMQARNKTTVNEDVKRYKILHETVNKELRTTADVQALNRDYEQVKRQRRREVDALDDAIAHLQEEFDYVQRAADVELGALESATLKMQAEREQSYQQQLQAHREALGRLEEKLGKLQQQNTEEINKLRVNRSKKEQAVQAAITEHDERIESLGAQIAKLQSESEEDTAKIMQLEEQLARLKQEEKEFNIERQVEQQREDHLEAIRQEQDHSAKVLQAYYRAFAARLAMAEEIEKLKKKSKKKKSTKKK